MIDAAALFLARALESLEGAASEYTNQRYHNCVNRAYFACFQAAMVALMRFGVRPAEPQPGLGHDTVQALFAGELIQRRKVFRAELRRILPDLAM